MFALLKEHNFGKLMCTNELFHILLIVNCNIDVIVNCTNELFHILLID